MEKNNIKIIKAIKGTKDILPDEIPNWNFITEIVKKTMQVFNYKEIRTPVFELTSLFSRGIGESTDIVTKEMYTFTDRSENSITLKPEMTASVVRAYIEHSLSKKSGLNKLFYISPMFRQERPQAGRLRQFHQFGIEAIGSHNPLLDAEIIQVAFIILTKIGLKDIQVKINSLGTPEERNRFSKSLKEYLVHRKNELSEDSKNRFDINVLRILDSKEKQDQEIIKDAPHLYEFLGQESLEHFEKVKQLLSITKIPFIFEPKLVRGLDYYTHTTFEVVSNKIGSQSALCGGGRYNLLVEQLGGDPTPGIGFAAGIERILLACANEKIAPQNLDQIDVYIICVDKINYNKVFEFAYYFRINNLSVDFDFLGRSIKAQMREANRLNSKFVLFIGGEELIKGEVQLKNMQNGEQEFFNANNLDGIVQKITKIN